MISERYARYSSTVPHVQRGSGQVVVLLARYLLNIVYTLLIKSNYAGYYEPLILRHIRRLPRTSCTRTRKLITLARRGSHEVVVVSSRRSTARTRVA